MSILAGLEIDPAANDRSSAGAAALPLGAERRRALQEAIRAERARMQRLPEAEQARRYAESRAKTTTLFALLQRLQEDPELRALVRGAVERTRLAPSDAELGRAAGRAFSAAFRAGECGFRPAVRFALDRLCEEFGAGNARRLKLSDLQRGYLASAARAKGGGFDGPAVVMAAATVEELWRVPSARGAAPHAAPATGANPAASDLHPAAPETGVPARPGEDLLATVMVAACLRIEAGVSDFAEFADAMAADLGEAVRPHLRMIHEAIRHCPGVDLSARQAAPTEGFLLAA